MTCATLNALMTASEYRAARAKFFPSEGSLQWYVRQNRKALIEAGALLLICGRHQVHADKFDAFILAAGEKAAASRAHDIAA